MKRRLLSGSLAATLLTLIGSAPSQSVEPPPVKTATPSPVPPVGSSVATNDLPDVLKVGERRSSWFKRQPSPQTLIQVRPHRLKDRPAATLFVRGLPVLTFLGDARVAPVPGVTAGIKVGQTQLNGNSQDPVWQATQLATRLHQLLEQRFDPRDINLIWDTQRRVYTLRLKSESLLFLDARVVLPDTKASAGDTALQITNRLRRGLGAPPLDQLPGEPRFANLVEASLRPVRQVLTGLASWYGPGFHGARTASGERFNAQDMTAAHRSLPFGTQVRVTNLRNGRSVVVRINDRGPFTPGREIDISSAAAHFLGLVRTGVAPVRLEVLGQ